MPSYGFSIKTKSALTPSTQIRYFSVSCTDDSAAQGLAEMVASNLANNAKVAVSKRIYQPSEGSFELPEGAELEDEETLGLRLVAEYEHNGKTYESSANVRVPCTDGDKAEDLADAFRQQVKLKGVDGVDHAVTDVQINSRRVYRA